MQAANVCCVSVLRTSVIVGDNDGVDKVTHLVADSSHPKLIQGPGKMDASSQGLTSPL